MLDIFNVLCNYLDYCKRKLTLDLLENIVIVYSGLYCKMMLSNIALS